MSLIDIHIGVLPERNTFYNAIDSIEHPQVSYYLIRDAESILELRSRGYAMGTSDYVSFCDDDDVFLNVDMMVKEAEKGTPAFFTNSWMKEDGHMSVLFRDDFMWKGIQSYIYGYPHNPYVVKRELMLEAIKRARERILDSNDSFRNTGVELAIGFELELMVGWKYVPMM